MFKKNLTSTLPVGSELLHFIRFLVGPCHALAGGGSAGHRNVHATLLRQRRKIWTCAGGASRAAGGAIRRSSAHGVGLVCVEQNRILAIRPVGEGRLDDSPNDCLHPRRVALPGARDVQDGKALLLDPSPQPLGCGRGGEVVEIDMERRLRMTACQVERQGAPGSRLAEREDDCPMRCEDIQLCSFRVLAGLRLLKPVLSRNLAVLRAPALGARAAVRDTELDRGIQPAAIRPSLPARKSPAGSTRDAVCSCLVPYGDPTPV